MGRFIKPSVWVKSRNRVEMTAFTTIDACSPSSKLAVPQTPILSDQYKHPLVTVVVSVEARRAINKSRITRATN